MGTGLCLAVTSSSSVRSERNCLGRAARLEARADVGLRRELATAASALWVMRSLSETVRAPVVRSVGLSYLPWSSSGSSSSKSGRCSDDTVAYDVRFRRRRLGLLLSDGGVALVIIAFDRLGEAGALVVFADE